MEVDGEDPTLDHVQKPGQVIGVGLNKVPKTAVERVREYRARKALLKQQCKQQQELDAIVEITTENFRSAGPSEDNQFPGPSEIRIIEKRAKAAEATRRCRAKKKALSESSKKQGKTAVQRMREYRERKKLAKKLLIMQQLDQDLDAPRQVIGVRAQCKQQQELDAIVEIATEDIRSAGSSEGNQFHEPSEIRIIKKAAEATASQSSKKQGKTAVQRMREYRERKKLAKKLLLMQQCDQDVEAIGSTPSSQLDQLAGTSTINRISAELIGRGNPKSQQQIKTERIQEYRERRNDNLNIESVMPVEKSYLAKCGRDAQRKYVMRFHEIEEQAAARNSANGIKAVEESREELITIIKDTSQTTEGFEIVDTFALIKDEIMSEEMVSYDQESSTSTILTEECLDISDLDLPTVKVEYDDDKDECVIDPSTADTELSDPLLSYSELMETQKCEVIKVEKDSIINDSREYVLDHCAESDLPALEANKNTSDEEWSEESNVGRYHTRNAHLQSDKSTTAVVGKNFHEPYDEKNLPRTLSDFSKSERCSKTHARKRRKQDLTVRHVPFLKIMDLDIFKSDTGNDIVDYFLTYNTAFSQLSSEQKIEIKSLKPTPTLTLQRKEKNANSTRKFQRNWYTLHPWLTGSVKRNKLYCFPCLLFSNNKDEWTTSGIGEESLQNFSLKVKRHTVSVGHITASVKLKELGTNRIDLALSQAARTAAIKHNEQVKKNRAILERLIQTICFLGKQELAFRDHNEKDSSDNKGNYLELLDFLALNESLIKEHLDSDLVFKGTSATIQNDLIDCITEVVYESIGEELQNAIFVSVQADETTDVSVTAQLSIILRYVDGFGEIQERFMGFFDVSADITAHGLSQPILQVLEKWNISKNKLVSQTYDGASVMAGGVHGVQTLIKQAYPHALFTHCYAHQLNLVLLHSAKQIKEVKLFIANLTMFHTFFSRSSKRSELLREKGFQLPNLSETRWNYHSRGVKTIQQHFFELVSAFRHVIDDENNVWDPSSIALANSILKILICPKFVYLMHLYTKIFVYVDILYEILQNKGSDIIQCIIEIQITQRQLALLRNEDIILKCVEESENMLQQVRQNIGYTDGDDGEPENFLNERTTVFLRRISYEILDNVTVQMDKRFEDFSKLMLCEIMNYSKFKDYEKNFPADAFNLLIQIYPFFDENKLKNELIYIYGHADKHLPPNHLLKYLINNSLNDFLPELVKLLKLVLTLPSTTASTETTSTLKRIKTFLRSTMSQNRLSNLSTIAIEKSFVKAEFSKDKFIDRVIDIFATKKEREINLIYRKL